MFSELQEKISTGDARVCVVGLGRIGIPLSLVFARSGFNVVGIDTDRKRVNMLNEGKIPFHYPEIEPWLSEVRGKFIATSNSKLAMESSDVIIVTVGTPTDSQLQMDYSQLHAVLHEIAQVNLRGKLIIIRSTAAPDTFMRIICPFLANETGLTPNKDFAAAVCPERILEGQAHRELYDLAELVGADSREVAQLVAALFKRVNPNKKMLFLSPTGAELGKLFTNIYRYINFALANEFGIWCEKYGEDANEIISAINVDYDRARIPTPGFAGGPCLAKDPLFLDNMTTFTGIISAAWKLNEAIPYHVVERLLHQFTSLHGKKILVLGLAFKKDSDDLRVSPSVKLVDILRTYGAEVTAYEPYSHSTQLPDLLKTFYDAIILATNHSCFKEIAPSLDGHANVLYDVWGMYSPSDFSHTKYLRLGRA